MKIIVVYELDGEDIRFRMVIPERNQVSGIVTLEGKALLAAGNPYGDVCAIYAGHDKHDKHDKHLFSITVARCTSGGL